jgi:hypothetical protein
MYRLDVDESWVKGSLHCHTTSSDGFLSPKEVADFYQSKKYGLLAITDHGKVTKDHINSREGTFLTGLEVSKGESRMKEPYHIVGLGVDDPRCNNLGSPQEVIDEINSAGGIAIIAHPSWSSLVHEDLVCLKDYAGIEVYNTGCDVEVAKGYAVTQWDSLLSSGAKCWGYAVDDAHRYSVPPIDADGGWVWVKNADDPAKMVESLRTGQFYSSTGPEIRAVKISSRAVHLRSSPVFRVNVVSHDGTGLCFDVDNLRELLKAWREPVQRKGMARMYNNVEANVESRVTSANIDGKSWKAEIAFSLKGIEQVKVEVSHFRGYVRVEATDERGKIAWINPLLLK